jgi:hypothetical protein
MKPILKKPVDQIIVSVEKTESISSKIRNEIGVPFSHSIQY